jgi:site-specific recombinase XerD
MDIETFVTEYLVSRSQETRNAYAADLRKFEHFLEERNLSVTALRPADITAFVRWLGKWRNYRTGRRGLSDASIQRHIAAVRAYYEWLRYDNPGLRDPTVLFHYRHTSDPAQIHPIPADTVEIMGEVSQSARDLAITKVFHRGGVRLSELICLDRSSVRILRATSKNPAFAEVRVLGKGRKYRTIYLSDDALDALVAYLNTRTDRLPALFLSSRGRRISRRTVQRIIDHLARAAGEAHAHPHQLRHSFATDMVRNGMEVQALSKLLGHEQLSTTMRYVELLDSDTAREYHAAMELVHLHRPRQQPIQSTKKPSQPAHSGQGPGIVAKPVSEDPASRLG